MAEQTNEQRDDQAPAPADEGERAPELARAEEAAEREAAQVSATSESDAAQNDAPAEPAPEATRVGPKASGERDGNTLSGASHREAVRSVHGETLTMSRGGLPAASAGAIEVRQGGIGRAEAQDIAVTLGGVGLARGDRVSVELGAVGAGIGREVRITQGAANFVAGQQVHVEQSLVQTVAANEVRFERPSVVVFLFARRVEGSVRALFDWRAGIAFGAVAGLVASILRRRN